MSDSCRACGSGTIAVGHQQLLDKYDVEYFACPRCELIQTEQPYWLDEAYTHAISRLDTGAVARNQAAARLTAVLARVLDVRGPALDYGGGHGVFVRMMRDLGYDFRWSDKYADNLYAAGFEGDPVAQHALVTAFEVLEHFADVRDDLARMFAPKPDYILVGTLLHTGYRPGWWYFLLESGQHVAFYSRSTLAYLAEQFGYDVISGPEYSLFARTPIRGLRRTIVKNVLARPGITAYVPRPLVGRASLVEPDHAAMRLRKSETP